ncbi:MAG: hypothetical protein WA160_13830 [Pseudobdellovibrio sp.]
MKQFIKNALIEVFLSFSPQRCQQEAMMKIDFKVGHERTHFMQLCFSALAAWPLILLISILYFDPTRMSWSLQKILENYSAVSFWLLDGRMTNMVIFFSLAFLIQWIFRHEILLIGLVFYFLLKSDIHFYLALSSVIGIILSRCCYLWWLHIDLKSRSRQIWTSFASLQIVGCVLAAIAIFYVVEVLQSNRYFAESVTSNRFEVLLLSVVLIYFIQFILASVWGHFRFKNEKMDYKETSNFPIGYTTATWILRFKMRPYFKKLIQDQTNKYLDLHQKNLDELATIKDLSPVSIPFQISQIIKTEIIYLKMASSRLTID